jgi:hypothetical protein
VQSELVFPKLASNGFDGHLAAPGHFKIRAVAFCSNSLSMRASNMHFRFEPRLNAAARLGPILLKTVA